VVPCSALADDAVREEWQALTEFSAALHVSGELAELRRSQARAWMWSEIDETLSMALRQDEQVAAVLAEVEPGVDAGHLSPATAARRVLDAFRGSADR
jgi:LAO/AO transport system kinase